LFFGSPPNPRERFRSLFAVSESAKRFVTKKSAGAVPADLYIDEDEFIT
jgi:hypothetical protein